MQVTSSSLPSVVFFFCDLEQSALQLFKELSNPGLDGSRAWRHNRILVLTPMTAPPAVAEPAVGRRSILLAGGGGGGCQGEIDRESLCDALSPMWNNRGGGSDEVLYFWTTTSLTLPIRPQLFISLVQIFSQRFSILCPSPTFFIHPSEPVGHVQAPCFVLAERRWRRWALYG